MKTLYIGGQSYKKNNGTNWKLWFYLILFLAILVSALKLTGSMIVEKWINQKGSDSNGYAFSIRDVGISLGRGKLTLMDVKVFNPKTSTELIEAPEVTLQLSWVDLIKDQEKKVSIEADKVDLILSKDLSSEIQRMKTSGEKMKNDLYLNIVEGKIAKLNVIEKKDDQSRTVIELNDVNMKVKDISLLSVNKKTEFTVTSTINEGGKLSLNGKTKEENGSTPWSINGSLKQVPAEIFNKIAGNKLPFSFNEPTLNADISAQSENGKVNGEISPEIRKVNLINEKPGVPTQTIARLLTDELTFTLPFTLKDQLTLQYVETFQTLKNYRKYPAAPSNVSSGATVEKVTQTGKDKKAFSFWPF